METKLSKLVACAAANDWQGALRIAARFQDLGDERTAIKRAHEVHANPDFYRQLGNDPEALIAAGIAALKRRYSKQLATLIDGANPMTTNFSAIQVAQLSAILTGGGAKRSNSKEAAVARFLKLAAEAGVTEDDAKEVLACSHFAVAENAVGLFVHRIEQAKAPAPGKPRARKAAVALAEANAPAPVAKPARAAKVAAAPKPEGKRAAILAAAQAGVLPAAPDFSADTHKAWRKRLAEVVALADARDIDGLKANTVEPKSSSRKAICAYRDLAITALEAQAAQAKAA